MTAFFLFTFGVIIGSFLNVVALRYSEDKNIFSLAHLGGRSNCQHCHQNLAWYELIPIFSFLLQKGKCWICLKKLSWQYPLVELASGLIFLLPLYFINYQLPITNYQLLSSVIWIAAFLIFLLIWAIDFRLYIIPDELNFLLAILGLILIDAQNLYGSFSEFSGSFLGSYSALFGLRSGVWQNHIGAMLIGAGIVGIIILLTRGNGMGMGDLKLMAALGLLYGWPDILFIFMFASVIGAAVSLVLMLARKKTMKSSVPFGPFLVMGAASVFFFGETFIRGYFNFFGF
mgnify:CR=1 FL=1